MIETVQEFLQYIKINKRYKSNTIRLYAMHLRDFINYMIVNYWYSRIQEIKIFDIMAYIQDLSSRNISTSSRYYNPTEGGKKLTASSIQIYIHNIKWLYKRLELYHTSTLKREKIPNMKVAKPKVEYYGDEDILKLADYAEQNEAIPIVGMRNKLYILMLYFTWCRASEIINLRFADIQDWKIQIIGKWDKHRLVYVNSVILWYLAEYRLAREQTLYNTLWCEINIGQPNYIFSSFDAHHKGKPVSYERLRRRMKHYSQQLWGSYHFHWLRHSFATKLMKGWIDIMKIMTVLWHEYVTTTQRYLHVENKEVENAYNSIFG